MSGQSLVTYVGVAHPWMCDIMGHMNVRHYAAMFDDASFQLLGHIAGADSLADTSLGWADVRSEVEYKHETKAGALLTICSRVIKTGRSSVTFRAGHVRFAGWSRSCGQQDGQRPVRPCRTDCRGARRRHARTRRSATGGDRSQRKQCWLSTVNALIERCFSDCGLDTGNERFLCAVDDLFGIDQ